MKWKTPEILEDGLITLSGFLFLPKCIGGEYRWLEHATWETYRNFNYIDGSYYYHDIRWVD